MTALPEYDRLETTGLWRPDARSQRREVIVSLGNASLVISGGADQALAHWSLAAIERLPGAEGTAIFHPDGDDGETLELTSEEMIAAIETLRSRIEQTRPSRGRLRWWSGAAILGLVLALAVFWLPGALVTHAVNVVPQATKSEIGAALLSRLTRVSGQACHTGAAQEGLLALAKRTGAQKITVSPGGVRSSIALPGGHILLNRAVIEDYETPDVAAGYVLAERLRAETIPPLRALLETSGTLASLYLLTTGRIPDRFLDRFVEMRVAAPTQRLPAERLLVLFAAQDLTSRPYAYALDVTGETTLALIEGDPARGRVSPPIMTDSAWLRLQAICGA